MTTTIDPELDMRRQDFDCLTALMRSSLMGSTRDVAYSDARHESTVRWIVRVDRDGAVLATDHFLAQCLSDYGRAFVWRSLACALEPEKPVQE